MTGNPDTSIIGIANASGKMNLSRTWMMVLALLSLPGFALHSPAGDWPQWRGPERSGYAAAGPAVLSLPKELKPVWRMAIGGGFSSPVVARGKLAYLDAQNGKEVLHVVEAGTGKELWQAAYAPDFEDEWGLGPRSTPMIDGDLVYAQSCSGEFACFNLSDGRRVWSTSFEKDFAVKFLGSKSNQGTATRRGNNGCGVIEGRRLILPVGGTQDASLVCFDKVTGEVLWKSGRDEAAYSSFLVATLAGVKQVVAFTADALLGADLTTGKLLWRVPLKTAAKRHAATPVLRGDQVMVNSHTFGLACFRISATADGLQAVESWINKNLKINLSTPVLVDGSLYCQGPSRDFICADAETGALRWSQPGFGQGKKDNSSALVVGKNLLVLTEDGTLLLLEANPEKYVELGRLQVCGNTWSFPAYADGKLYVRDSKHLLCVDLLQERR